MNQYDDAEEALTEANFLNNQNAGKKLVILNKELDYAAFFLIYRGLGLFNSYLSTNKTTY
jgi:hypothetical protein